MNQNFRTQRVTKNIITGLIYTIVSSFFPFFYRTAMIKYLGESYLGLSSFCVSILEVINFSNLGISTAFQYHLYKPISESDNEKINELLSFYNRVFHMLGSMIILVGLIISPFLKPLIKCDIPDDINLYIVFFIYLITQALEYFLIATTDLYISARQESYISNIFYVITTAILYLTQIYYIKARNYYAVVVVLLARVILCGFIRYCLRRTKYRDIHFNIKRYKLPKENKRSIVIETVNITIFKVRDVTRNSIDSIVVSAFLGLKALAKFQNYYMVLLVPVIIKRILTNAVSASFGDYNASNEKKKTYDIFEQILFISLYASGYVSLIYFVLIQDFITFWIGNEMLLPETTAVLFSIYIYLIGMGEVANLCRSTMNVWSRGKVVVIVEVLSNILLDVALAKVWGVNGVLVATLLCMIFIYLPYEFWIMSRNVFTNSAKKIFMIITKNIVWITACSGMVIVINRMVKVDGVIEFFFKACICAIVPIVLFVTLLWKDPILKKLFIRLKCIM